MLLRLVCPYFSELTQTLAVQRIPRMLDRSHANLQVVQNTMSNFYRHCFV